MIDLIPFSGGPDHWRASLQMPFNFEGATYAANGHIVVAVPLRAEYGETTDRKVGELLKHILRDVDSAEFVPFCSAVWPQLPAQEVCQDCGGSGKWDDDGLSEECETCEGTGKKPRMISAEWRGAIFQTKYLDMIAALPEAEIEKTAREGYPIFFRFNGGVGALMSMRHPAEIHFGDLEKLDRRE